MLTFTVARDFPLKCRNITSKIELMDPFSSDNWPTAQETIVRSDCWTILFQDLTTLFERKVMEKIVGQKLQQALDELFRSLSVRLHTLVLDRESIGCLVVCHVLDDL